MDIDIRTLLLFLSLALGMQFTALLLQQFLNKIYPGPGWWALGAAVLSGAFAFSLQRDNPALVGPVAIVANNVLFAASLAFFYVGVSRFFGRTVHVGWLVAFCTATTLAAIYYTYFVPDLASRRVALSVNQAVLSLNIAARLLTSKTRTTTVSASLLAGVFAAYGLFYAARAIGVFFVGAETELFAAALTTVSTHTVTFILSTLWTFGFILMVNQRLSEEAREDHANLDHIFDTMPDPVLITRRQDGQIARVNAAFTKLVGYTRAEVIGKTTVEIAYWSDAADRRRLLAELDQHGGYENLEAVFRRRDGSQYTAIVSARLITLAGTPYIIAAVRDISERKRAEAALRDSEERFRLIVQNSPNIISLWDRSGQLEYISPAVQHVLGISAEDMLNRLQAPAATAGTGAHAQLPVEQWSVTGFAAEDAVTWANLMATVAYCADHPGAKRRAQYRLAAWPGKYRDLDAIVQSYVHTTLGVEVVAIASDVTEQRALERQLQAANAELEQRVYERTAALSAALADLRRANAGKDAFLAAVSHELRTPVMGILSMSEALAEQMAGAPDSTEAHQVELINQSGRRLHATLNGVIRYTRLMAGAVPVNAERSVLADVCAAAVRSIQDAASRQQQRVLVSVEPPGLEIVSDSSAITEVLQALLDNAAKFTPAQGQISLTATPATGTAAGAVQIVVADTGIGMNDEQIAGLFHPLSQGDQTLSRRFSGLGIGLAYAHKLVELLGGTLIAASTPGVGSCFTITLPQQQSGI